MRVKLEFAPAIQRGGVQHAWFFLESADHATGGYSKRLPGLSTIADIAHVIARSFDLEDLCPWGVVLSMEGFVLPPGQSSELIRDGDQIRYASFKLID
jgi:hypothetical protein